MKIYTRTGDQGTTGLFGGTRIAKDHLLLHVYGTVDELNACLGLAVSLHCPIELEKELVTIQQWLFEAGSDLATPISSSSNIRRLPSTYATMLEQWIDAHETHLQPLQQFIVPGGSPLAATLHNARTICRRAERWAVTAKEQCGLSENILPFLNRLSDYLFVIARRANAIAKIPECSITIPRNPSEDNKN